jgi:hypothetical protein
MDTNSAEQSTMLPCHRIAAAEVSECVGRGVRADTQVCGVQAGLRGRRWAGVRATRTRQGERRESEAGGWSDGSASYMVEV